VRKLVVICALVAFALPLLVHAQTGAAGKDVGTVGTKNRAAIPTGPVSRLPNGHPDLNGVWVGGGPINDLEKDGGLKPGEIDSLLLPWAKELMSKRDVTLEPHNQCLPMGVPRTTPFPFRFLQNYTDKQATHLYILHEGNIHTYRQIFMDGRQHPPADELDSTWLGHSIGTWDGDTLVIDTVGFNDKWWFDRRGHPHTERLHTIERWTRKDMGHMENVVTIDDPGAYTKPFTVRFMATWTPGNELLEYICQENNQYGVETLPGGLPPADTSNSGRK
jgi:hypothetical protein